MHIRALKHSCGWSRCLVAVRLCSLGSLCVISISVVFDLTNHLTEKQEMVHLSFYAKQLKTDQNSLSAYRKHLQKYRQLPNSKLIVKSTAEASLFLEKSMFRFKKMATLDPFKHYLELYQSVLDVNQRFLFIYLSSNHTYWYHADKLKTNFILLCCFH